MRKLGLKITAIKKVNLENFCIRLRFSDGFVGEVSLARFFSPPKGLAVEVLKGNIFNSCFIESGALAWPNGLEFCPDALRILIVEQSKRRVA